MGSPEDDTDDVFDDVTNHVMYGEKSDAEVGAELSFESRELSDYSLYTDHTTFSFFTKKMYQVPRRTSTQVYLIPSDLRTGNITSGLITKDNRKMCIDTYYFN